MSGLKIKLVDTVLVGRQVYSFVEIFFLMPSGNSDGL